MVAVRLHLRSQRLSEVFFPPPTKYRSLRLQRVAPWRLALVLVSQTTLLQLRSEDSASPFMLSLYIGMWAASVSPLKLLGMPLAVRQGAVAILLYRTCCCESGRGVR